MTLVRAAAVALATVVLVTCAGLTGCGGGSGGAAAPCAEPEPVAGERLADLPLDLAEAGTVTSVETRRDYVGAKAVAESTIDATYGAFPRVLRDAGFEIAAEENEGIEADIFFAKGTGTTGSAKFTEGPCQGQVTITLTIADTA